MKKITALLLALLMTLSLCACGKSSDSVGNAKQASRTESIAAPAAASNIDYQAAYEESVIADEEYYSDGGLGSNDADLSEASSINPDKIIYSANVTLETTKFDDSIKGLDELIKSYNGWVESSSVQGNNYYSQSRGYASTRSASYTIRIPSKNFQTMMGSLSQLGNVPYTNIYTDNVTAQYYDTQARLEAYEVQRDRLLEMMDKAETVSDIITIQNELTELQYKIDSLTSSLKNWDRQVDYSYIYLNVQEVQEYTPEVSIETPFGKKLSKAFTDGIAGAIVFFQDFTLFVAEAFPFLIILGVIGYFIIKARRNRRSGERQRRREEKAKAKAEAKARKAAEKQAKKDARRGIKSEAPAAEAPAQSEDEETNTQE